jgi:exodeoxyribonuclease V alpha subunit
VEAIKGEVNSIIYRSSDGYTVLELVPEKGLAPIVVVGPLAGVEEGESLEVQGRWSTHPRFGRQLKAVRFQSAGPMNEKGLLRYLASGAVQGIGPALAARLVEHFGPNLFDIVEERPERLREVSGIGDKRAGELARALVQQRVVREVMVFLQGLEIGSAMALRIYRQWGDESVSRVQADPYRLVRDVDGIGFSTADTIAGKLGIEGNSPSRLSAGVLHLAWTMRDAGDTILPRAELILRTAEFLQADEVQVEAALDELVATGPLKQRVVDTDDGAELMVGMSALVMAEESIATQLLRLLRSYPADVDDEDLALASELELTEEQQAAVRTAVRGPVSVITGGPGTGKTTVLRTLVTVLEQQGRTVLAAPTGRAAKRMSEATGASATTVHRLLGFRGRQFEFNKGNRLDVQTVIVDEVSMLDALVARSLLEALPDNCRLVLVGDSDQLPSVGAGNVLADIIASDAVEVSRLTSVFRQKESSAIVLNAHRIRVGQIPEASPTGASKGGEFHIVVARDPQHAQQLVLEVCCNRIPKAYNLDPTRDLQVLTPMHRGLVGTVALNELLQKTFNPRGKGFRRPKDELRIGDKVMQVRNDYDRDVYNGDIGWVVDVDNDKGGLVVEFDGTRVEYGGDQHNQLTLAYCMSVHKSQGSEYPAVVIPLLTQHYVLLQRNLLYTAVTRAKQLVVLVCSPEALKIAIGRMDQGRRRTLLASELSKRAAAGESMNI